MRSFAFVACAAIGLGGVIGGCEIVTGGTDGYTAAADAGNDVATVDTACPIDGALCVKLECASSADCVPPDAAESNLVCCAGIAGNTVNIIGTSCQPTSCSLGAPVCLTSAECGGAACTYQQCPLLGAVVFKACGLVPGCSAIVSDAGTDASIVTDAATDAGTVGDARAAVDADTLDASAGD